VVFPAGQKVEVMSLRPGQITSDVWERATVDQVSCEGQYTLVDEQNNPVAPALPTGIEAHHLRGLHEQEVANHLTHRVQAAERLLVQAKQDAEAHQKRIQARQARAEQAAEGRAKQAAAEKEAAAKAAAEKAAAEAQSRKEEEAKAESKAKLSAIDQRMEVMRREYEQLAAVRQQTVLRAA
jgi:hypothetical protein